MNVYLLLRLLLMSMIDIQSNKSIIPLPPILRTNNHYADIREMYSTARYAITLLREMIMLMRNTCAPREILGRQLLMLVTWITLWDLACTVQDAVQVVMNLDVSSHICSNCNHCQ